jgi:xanthine dehydrogenase large subunit
MADTAQTSETIRGGVHGLHVHDSASKHVAGSAVYIDDIPEPPRMLHVHIAMSARAHARITRLDLDAVRAAPGVACVLTAQDVPGTNDVSPVKGDDPMFAEGLVEYAGQSIFAVAASNIDQARAAAALADIDYEDLEPLISVDDAMDASSFVLPDYKMTLGDAKSALNGAARRLDGRFRIGGQDHFYLEGMIALAVPGEDSDVHVYSSTQHPSEVQHNVAKVLGVPEHAVTIELRRMGGGFGGKESQPSLMAGVAALVVRETGRAAKVRLDRDDDMIMTGKRHDFRIDYDVGFDEDGMIEGIEYVQAARCGMSADLSSAICDRAMFHADNCYYLGNATIKSHRCKTHTVSNTAFRGFGGPQGMIAMERVIDEIAFALDKDPLEIRKLNFYGGEGRNVTPYHMEVEDNVIGEIIEDLEASSDYAARRAATREFNASSRYLKKGIALTPVKFGISFTTSHLNQAGALVHVYKDGSVHLNHGGTEMGQGLFTKVAQVVAEEFQIDIEKVKITSTTTAKVPNTSATAASSGSDLNGMAAQAAARAIKTRLIEHAAEAYSVDRDQIEFLPNRVRIGNQVVSFEQLAHEAYMSRVSLSSTGFYKTPKIHWDAEAARGRPFYYFAYGAAVSEVLLDTLTGENRVTRVDILHDAGQSLNPALDYGQIEGGFIQGMGWLTTEELWWNDDGQLKTHAPSTYKIPACSDRPDDFRMMIWDKGRNVENTIYRSKAIGEPPLMLAISVFAALTDAVAAAADYKVFPNLDAPATPECLLLAVDDARRRAAEADQ